MAIYRTINMLFWRDPKIADDFTPEDKYFFLYLLTNPHTNLCGCYEISIKQASDETGYGKDTIERLLNRFEEVHHVLNHCKSTKEVLILNWHKYNWTASSKFISALKKEIVNVKNETYRDMITNWMNELKPEADTVPIAYEYPTDTSVTDTDSNTNNRYSNEIKDIISYLNSILGTKYTCRCESNNKHIRARLAEGHTVEEFKHVIDKKHAAWGSDAKMSKYLRPETLFGAKFESYLNEKGAKSNGDVKYDAREVYGDDFFDRCDSTDDVLPL